MYRIAHTSTKGEGQVSIDLYLGLEDVEKVKLHEETKPEALTSLKRSIEKARFLWHPIVVDLESRVILDGMHRATALRELNFRYVPCLFVDVMNPSIKLKRWDRTFLKSTDTHADMGGVLDAIRGMGVTVKDLGKCKIDDLYREEAEGGGNLGYLYHHDGRAFELFADIGGAKETYDHIGGIERRLKGMGLGLEHTAKASTLRMLEEGTAEYVLIPRPLKKEEVIGVATRGEVFIPKATRFVLPVRVMFMNVPVSLLRQYNNPKRGMDFDLEERNTILEKILCQKNLYKLRGNITLDRHYDEPYLYIFE